MENKCINNIAFTLHIIGLVSTCFAQASNTGQQLGESKCNVERAQRVFQQCKVCHSVDKAEPHLTGPNLFGIYGRPVGSTEGFSYSRPLRKAVFEWRDETLDGFLTSPLEYLPGTRMVFGGGDKP